MEVLLGQVRIGKGVTLVQLAGRTGISKSTLNNYENGKTVPNLYRLKKIAIALDVEIMDLFDLE